MNNIEKLTELERVIEHTINYLSLEEYYGNTADYVLANYVLGCLDSYKVAKEEQVRREIPKEDINEPMELKKGQIVRFPKNNKRHCTQCQTIVDDMINVCPQCGNEDDFIELPNDDTTTMQAELAETKHKLAVAEKALDMAVNSINEDTVYMLPIQSSLFIQQAQQEV